MVKKRKKTITIKRVTVDLEIVHDIGADLEEMLNEMDYEFESNTDGVVIENSEVVDISGI